MVWAQATETDTRTRMQAWLRRRLGGGHGLLACLGVAACKNLVFLGSEGSFFACSVRAWLGRGQGHALVWMHAWGGAGIVSVHLLPWTTEARDLDSRLASCAGTLLPPRSLNHLT